MAWFYCQSWVARAANDCFYTQTNTCEGSASASLSITNPGGITCIGCPITIGAATNWSYAVTRAQSVPNDSSRCQTSTWFLTNAPVFSNAQWAVSGCCSTNGTNLSATFCPDAAGIGTITFTAEVSLPTNAEPCGVNGAATATASCNFYVIAITNSFAWSWVPYLTRDLNDRHSEYVFCQDSAAYVWVGAYSYPTDIQLPECWTVAGHTNILSTNVSMAILGTNTYVCSAGTSGKTNTVIIATAKLSASNPRIACVGDSNMPFTVTSDSFDEITWQITGSGSGGGGASVAATNTGRTALVNAGSNPLDSYQIHAFVTGLSDCGAYAPLKVIRVEDILVTGLYGVTYSQLGDTYRVCASDPGATTTTLTATAVMAPGYVAPADLPASYSMTNTGPGISTIDKLSSSVSLATVGTNVMTVRAGSSSKTITIIVSRAKIANTDPVFACTGDTNSFSLTPDSSADVTWQISPTNSGLSFAGPSTGRVVSVASASQCGVSSLKAFVTGLSGCSGPEVSISVVKTTSLAPVSGGASRYPATNDASTTFLTFAPLDLVGPPCPVTVSAGYCPATVLKENLPSCWDLSATGPGVSGTDKLTRTINPSIPGTNDLVVSCNSSSNTCQVITLKTDIVETEEYAAVEQTNGVLFHLTGDSVLPVEWKIEPSGGGVGFLGGTNTGPAVYIVPGSYTVTAFSQLEPNCKDTAIFTVVKVDLDRLTFFPPSGYPYILRDNGGGPYNTNHWTRTTSDPVAFTRNTSPKVEASFTVIPSSFSDTIKIRGEGTYGFPSTSCNPTNSVVQYPQTESTNTLPNRVDMINTMAINWSFSVARTESFAKGGKSENIVYVTLGDPTGTAVANFYRTVVHLACSSTGATNESGAVENTWGLFSGCSVQTWDGKALTYYGTEDGGDCYLTPCLLSTRNGQCHSFASLLADAFRANGVGDVAITRVLPPVDHDKFGVNNLRFRLPPDYPDEPFYLFSETQILLV